MVATFVVGLVLAGIGLLILLLTALFTPKVEIREKSDLVGAFIVGSMAAFPAIIGFCLIAVGALLLLISGGLYLFS